MEIETLKFDSVINNNVKLSGDISFNSNLRFFCNYDGTVKGSGILYISKGSVVNADIEIDCLYIEGTVKGNITARKSVYLLENSQLFGNIETSDLYMADNVTFEGSCNMINSSNSDIDIFSASTSQIKEILSDAKNKNS